MGVIVFDSASPQGNGVVGEQGPEGPTGPQGPPGEDGDDGASGARGADGLDGDLGPQGYPGPQGDTGSVGPAGTPGSSGAVGATGPSGPVGATGPTGLKGDTGNAGSQGLQGDTGAPGTAGTAGATGPSGPIGATGPSGAVGATGPQGIQGIQGVAGVGFSTVKITSDQASTATALANATGLAFSVTSGAYYFFRASLVYRTAALTTGIRIGATTPTFNSYAASVSMPRAADGASTLWVGALTTSGDSVVSDAVQAINTDYIASVEGVIAPSANGTVQIQFATEVAASAATLRPGSYLSYAAI